MHIKIEKFILFNFKKEIDVVPPLVKNLKSIKIYFFILILHHATKLKKISDKNKCFIDLKQFDF